MIFKNLAIAALLMAFAQAPFGTGGQATRSPSVPPRNQMHQTALPGSPNTARSQADTSSCPGGNCDEWPTHIKVANAPPVDPPWPLHERITWAASLVLVVLGYVGIMLALSTLRKIERQTKFAEEAASAAADNARAALLHAEAIVSAERPWILVTVEPSRGTKNGFAVMARNRGRTPARIVSIPHKIEFAEDESNLPEIPQYQDASSGAPFVPIILLPGDSAHITTFYREDVKDLCGSEERFKRVESWEEKIFLYGRVTYHDLLSPKDEQVHQSDWCFWYIHGHQNSGFVPAGPHNYNLHT